MKDIKITISPGPGSHLCDFCSSPMIVKDYDCEDYVIPDTWSKSGPKVDLGSRGKWAACQICADLVDTGDKLGLMERALRCFYQAHPETPKDGPVAEEIIKFLFDLHHQFWERRK